MRRHLDPVFNYLWRREKVIGLAEKIGMSIRGRVIASLCITNIYPKHFRFHSIPTSTGTVLTLLLWQLGNP